jgi:integration host factor subunit beta
MMIKSELIEVMSQKLTHLSEKDVALSVNHIIDKICHTLTDKGRVEIRGFGTFSLHFRPPRLAHNPKTGEKLMTSPKHAVHFKPGKEMRELINATMGTPIQNEAKDDIDDVGGFEKEDDGSLF